MKERKRNNDAADAQKKSPAKFVGFDIQIDLRLVSVFQCEQRIMSIKKKRLYFTTEDGT